MFSHFIDIIETIVVQYGALGVFFAAILEELIAPIPSTAVILSAGFFLIEGTGITLGALLQILLYIAIPVSLGVTIGSLLVYFLAFYLGRPFIERFGKYVALSWSDIEKAEAYFAKRKSDELILFVVRALPIIPSVAINAFCGLMRWNLKSYLVITVLGTIVRAFILGLAGWQLGNLYHVVDGYIHQFEKIVLAVAILAVLGFIGYRMYKRKKGDKTPATK